MHIIISHNLLYSRAFGRNVIFVKSLNIHCVVVVFTFITVVTWKKNSIFLTVFLNTRYKRYKLIGNLTCPSNAIYISNYLTIHWKRAYSKLYSLARRPTSHPTVISDLIRERRCWEGDYIYTRVYIHHNCIVSGMLRACICGRLISRISLIAFAASSVFFFFLVLLCFRTRKFTSV